MLRAGGVMLAAVAATTILTPMNGPCFRCTGEGRADGAGVVVEGTITTGGSAAADTVPPGYVRWRDGKIYHLGMPADRVSPYVENGMLFVPAGDGSWLSVNVPERVGPTVITEVEHLLTVPTTLSVDPGGWAAVGLPTNFRVDARTHTAFGVLFGNALEVRFTPTGARWDYGDGAVRSTTSLGRAWTTSTRFAVTPTSHVYADRGDYRATATVTYSAQYRFPDSEWTDITGTVERTTPAVTIAARVVSTVVTADSCRAETALPGC